MIGKCIQSVSVWQCTGNSYCATEPRPHVCLSGPIQCRLLTLLRALFFCFLMCSVEDDEVHQSCLIVSEVKD